MSGESGWTPNPPEPGRCYDEAPESHYHCDLEAGHEGPHKASRGFYSHNWHGGVEGKAPLGGSGDDPQR